ncbi:MAG TPA: PQQ-binding-like beta-propeller repeat protein [Solirubrobacter sp.]|nr:PQQ-binding-like beta-propeller repeat protein [Solirubrobacter sp.]
MTARKKLLLGAAVVVLLLIAGGVVFALTRPPEDVSNPNVEFDAEPTATEVPDEIPQEPTKGSKQPDPLRNFVWATYGYSKDRRKFLPASKLLRPPFWRVWTYPGSVLLEFPPVMAEGKLFLLKNNGALHAIDKRTGKVRWKRKLGILAAASPAYGNGRVFVPLLQRGKNKAGAVYALDAKTGKILWKRLLPSRSESSPVFDNDRIYLGSENGTVYALRAGDGAVRWTFKASGAVKAGLALANGKLFFGDYAGRVYAIRQADGHQVWATGTKGGKFGLRSGQFYSTAAVAYGRVYIGNTDGRMYSFATSNGKLAWTKGTGSYVYASPAVAQLPGMKPTVYFGSYDGRFYAVDARTGRVRWSRNFGGKISGGATVVGDIVYFSNYGKRDTTGLGVRTGKTVFKMRRGAFNPVISDGRTIFLTGFSSLYALRPSSQSRRR